MLVARGPFSKNTDQYDRSETPSFRIFKIPISFFLRQKRKKLTFHHKTDPACISYPFHA